jgi:hypothetical protein
MGKLRRPTQCSQTKDEELVQRIQATWNWQIMWKQTNSDRNELSGQLGGGYVAMLARAGREHTLSVLDVGEREVVRLRSDVREGRLEKMFGLAYERAHILSPNESIPLDCCPRCGYPFRYGEAFCQKCGWNCW